jgi:hypothetical protein
LVRIDGHDAVEDKKRGVKLFEVCTRSCDHEVEFRTARAVKSLCLGTCGDLKGPCGPTQATLTVCDERQVLMRTAEACHRTKLAQSLGVPAGCVGGQCGGLTYDVDATTAGKCHLRMAIGTFRILVEKSSSHDQMPRDIFCVVLAERAKSAVCIAVKILTGHVLRHIWDV